MEWWDLGEMEAMDGGKRHTMEGVMVWSGRLMVVSMEAERKMKGGQRDWMSEIWMKSFVPSFLADCYHSHSAGIKEHVGTRQPYQQGRLQLQAIQEKSTDRFKTAQNNDLHVANIPKHAMTSNFPPSTRKKINWWVPDVLIHCIVCVMCQR